MSAPSSPPEPVRIFRFGLVGLLNSAVGYSVILAMLWSGMGDIVSNVAGYAVGLAVGFVLNTRWTFGVGAWGPRGAARYCVAFLVAYSANLMVIAGAGRLGFVGSPPVHLAGMAVYSVLFYALASRAVFVGRAVARTDWRAFVARRWPEALACALLVVFYALFFDIPVSHDVVWQMWIARQLSHGAALYRDILEINPPLWFWLAVPVERVAEFLGVSPVRAIVAAVFVQIALAMALLARLVEGDESVERAVVLAAALVAVVVVPLPDFAQREHLALIGAVPYLALVARRARGTRVPWPLAVAVGAFAAPAFALKHYFILVPVLLEIWLLARTRRAWRPVRPETLVLALAAVLYALAVLAFAPEFISVMAPMVGDAYGGYEASFGFQISRRWVLIWGIAGLALCWPRRSFGPLATAALVVAAGFCVSYFLQGKGWRYHGAPVSALLFLVSALVLTRLPGGRWGKVGGVPVAVAALLIVVHSLELGPYANRRAQHVERLLSDVTPGAAVLTLTANPSSAWPMVEELGLRWPSRHFAFWMLNAVHAAQVSGPPEIILVDSFERSLARGFDVVGFFERDGDFARMFSSYRREGVSGRFTSYRRMDGREPKRPRGCRMVF